MSPDAWTDSSSMHTGLSKAGLTSKVFDRCANKFANVSAARFACFAGGGKSECYKTLRDAMNLLQAADPESKEHQAVNSLPPSWAEKLWQMTATA